MQNSLKYGTPLLLIIFIAIYFYKDGARNAEFKQKMEEIDKIRVSLMDTLTNVKKRTDQRDEKLKEALRTGMNILDTLNSSLNKVNKNTKIIDSQIAKNQKSIEDLWKNN
jgi:hypothetical protein